MRSIEDQVPPAPGRVPRYGPRRATLFDGIGRSGVALAACAALLDALKGSLKFFAVVPLGEALAGFAENFALSLAVAAALLVAIVVARNVAVRHRLPRHVLVYVAVAVVVLVAVALDGALETSLDAGRLALPSGIEVLFVFAPDAARYMVFGALMASAWLFFETADERAADAKRIAVESARMAEQVVEARLSMLEAQIEPHFLFNTLAHVRRLYETDPASGARMLASVRAYLGVALPQMREPESTLARELSHVRAYLEIQQIRMGRRLTWAIDVASGIEEAGVPPLMVLTLVENAVKHGLSPTQGGGRIDVVARREDGRIVVSVRDTGRGFTTYKGAGTGLANIRARLRSRFGDRASLALAQNAPSGVVATLAVPGVAGVTSVSAT